MQTNMHAKQTNKQTNKQRKNYETNNACMQSKQTEKEL